MNEENLITNIPITQWAMEDRPREKMLLKGTAALTNAELLAILINTGNKNHSAVDLGKIVLQHAGNNLNQLGKLTVNDLKKVKGIGEAKAITIAAALELSRRREAEMPHEQHRIVTLPMLPDWCNRYLKIWLTKYFMCCI